MSTVRLRTKIGFGLTGGATLAACSESAGSGTDSAPDGGTGAGTGNDASTTVQHDGAIVSNDDATTMDEGGASSMARSACPVRDRAIPAGSFLVHATDRTNLQALMDAHTNVFLEAGDYAKGGPTEVRIQSGHGLYAAGKATLPTIVVPAGTSLATVSGVR